MSRVVSSSSIQRASTVAAGNVKAIGQAAATMGAGKAVDPSEIGEVTKRVEKDEVNKGVEKEVFWMKDPKTGNWMPETHFNEVDAAELRTKFLSKRP